MKAKMRNFTRMTDSLDINAYIDSLDNVFL